MTNYGMSDSFKQDAMSVAMSGYNHDRGCEYAMVIHTANGEFTPTVLESVSIKRDFNGTFTDTIKIVFTIILSDYIKYIKPNKNKLRVTLTHDTPGAIHIDEYKLIIALEDAPVSADTFKEDPVTLNNSVTTIHAECVDESILFLKQQNKGIILKDCTVETALSVVLDKALDKVTSKFGVGKNNINIITPDNKRVYKNIVVPNYIKALELPVYMQEKLGGVYNGSINSYFYRENNSILSYIFPLYRPNLLKTIGKKLIVIAGNDLTTAAGDATYALDDNNDLKILVQQKNKMDDDNIEMLGKGGSLKGIDANTVRGRPVTVSKGSVEVKKSSMYRNMKEDLADGLSDIINVKPTDNFYEPRSKILKNKLSKVLIEWHHSNARLIYPYMPVIYLEEDASGTNMREGLVTGVDIFTIVKSKQETCVLSLLITDKEKGPHKPIKLF